MVLLIVVAHLVATTRLAASASYSPPAPNEHETSAQQYVEELRPPMNYTCSLESSHSAQPR